MLLGTPKALAAFKRRILRENLYQEQQPPLTRSSCKTLRLETDIAQGVTNATFYRLEEGSARASIVLVGAVVSRTSMI